MLSNHVILLYVQKYLIFIYEIYRVNILGRAFFIGVETHHKVLATVPLEVAVHVKYQFRST